MNKWYKFLLTEERNFLISNLMKIYESLENVPTQNATAEILEMVHPKNFLDYLKDNKLENIFKTYEIDGLLGHGIKGLAFSLKEPHENYVLKFEMHYHQQGAARPGVDYPQQVANKQEKGEYDPNQVNVLESEFIEGEMIDTTSHAEGIDFYISVMSKARTSTYAGKAPHKWRSLHKGEYQGGMSTKEAINDFTFSNAPMFLDAMISIAYGASMPNLDNWIRDRLFYSKFGAKLPRDKRDVLTRISKVLGDKIRNETPKSVSSFLYNVFEDQIQFLSKQQFLDICREYYDRELDAKSAGKQYSDFHAGNVGFGATGKLMSFDV